MTDRELLEQLFDFMVKRNYVLGDEKSIRDMVLRYQQPPLTMHHRVCMQMTVQDYANLTALLERIVEHFSPDNIPAEESVVQFEPLAELPDGFTDLTDKIRGEIASSLMFPKAKRKSNDPA